MTIFPPLENVFEDIMDPFVFGNPHTIWCKTVNHAIKRGVEVVNSLDLLKWTSFMSIVCEFSILSCKLAQFGQGKAKIL